MGGITHCALEYKVEIKGKTQTGVVCTDECYLTYQLACHFTECSASTERERERLNPHLKACSLWIIQELKYAFFLTQFSL